MTFALVKDGQFVKTVDATLNYPFSETNIKPPYLATPEERLSVGLYDFIPVQATPAPFGYIKGGTEYIVGNGVVTEQYLPDTPMDATTLSEVTAKAIAENNEKLWKAAYEYEFSRISGVAIGLLALGVAQNKPKCLAVAAWSAGLWNMNYYPRKSAMVAVPDPSVFDFSNVGEMPHSVPELSAEVYG